MSKPLILVTNDDGITAPGIRALVEVCAELGEIVVVAPDSPRSGQGHAITLNDPIRLREVNQFGQDITSYECSGTPVDCVKLAKHVILKDRQIDLCVSGVNHGSNASINIIYSGTMSAAMEASIEGIESIGFSLLDYSFKADFEPTKHYAKILIQQVLANGLKECRLLNVNIPKLSADEIKGMKICSQGHGVWEEEFKEGVDPRGGKYYWLDGEFISDQASTDSDLWALANGYIAIVPSWHDMTKKEALTELNYLEI